MVKIQRLHFLLSPGFLYKKHDREPRHYYRHISCWQPNLRLFRCCVLDHWKGLCFGRGKKEQVPVEYVYIYTYIYIIYACNVQIVSQRLVRLYDLNACIGKYSVHERRGIDKLCQCFGKQLLGQPCGFLCEMECQKFESSRLDEVLRVKLRLKDRRVSQTDLTLDHKRRAMSFIITWPTWLIWITWMLLHPLRLQPLAKRWPLKGTGLKLEQRSRVTSLVELWHLRSGFLFHFLKANFFPKSWSWNFCCRLVEATFWIRCFVRSHKPGRATLFFEGLASRSLCLWLKKPLGKSYFRYNLTEEIDGERIRKDPKGHWP